MSALMKSARGRAALSRRRRSCPGKGLCRLPGLVKTTAVAPGATVVTSGIGGIFPRNLIIGTVKEIVDDPADISSYAVIEPGVKITDLEDVFIISSFDGQLSAAKAGE